MRQEIHEFHLRSFICGDDPYNGNFLKEIIRHHFPQINIVGSATSIKETRKFLTNNRIDLLFIDEELPDGDGLDLLTAMNEIPFEVIISTSRTLSEKSHYHNTLDYLSKPVSKENLATILHKLLHKKNPALYYAGKEEYFFPTTHKIPLHTSEGYLFINTEEIIHLEAARSYSTFHLKTGKKIMVSKPMSEFEGRLNSQNFFRVHHSHIINLDLMVLYVRGEGGHVVMTDQTIVPVSRSRKEEFLKIIRDL